MKIKSLLVLVPLVFIQAVMRSNETPCQNGIEDFIFIKKYSINGLDMQYVENSYPLTKGTSYLINLCSKDCNSNNLIISIFDRQRNLVTTNESNNKLSNSMRFDCNATGIYYMRYQSMSPGKFCGESVLAFKRSKLEENTSSAVVPGTAEK